MTSLFVIEGHRFNTVSWATYGILDPVKDSDTYNSNTGAFTKPTCNESY